jgi:hypothetical protein
MRPLTLNDIIDIARYEQERPEFRKRIIELKRHRRIAVGNRVSFVFENRDTMRFQVQEMMRVERIVLDDRIQEELDTYNELVPGSRELKATMMIEVTEPAEIRPVLDRFKGIDRGGTTYLMIGDDRVEGEYEGGRSSEIKLSAVHYVTFLLSDTQVGAVRALHEPLSLVIDHAPAGYHHEISLAADVHEQLAADLHDE